eukprot:3199977-Pleurochrysis_carterae.AAC.3
MRGRKEYHYGATRGKVFAFSEPLVVLCGLVANKSCRQRGVPGEKLICIEIPTSPLGTALSESMLA